MLITPHALTGAAVGTLVTNPLLVIPLAICSHFILDSVPHWQETLAPYTPTKKTYIRIPIDVALTVTLVWVAVQWQPDHTAPMLLGAVTANMPDLDVMTIVIPKLRRNLIAKYWDWHCRIQRETASLFGVLTQLIVIGLSLVVIYESR